MKYWKASLAGIIICSSLLSPAFSKDSFVREQLFTKSSANIKTVLEVDKKVFKTLEPTVMHIKLTDKKNQPLTKASIIMSLDMSDMYMPKNEVKFKEIQKGLYEGEALFTMQGNWQLNTVIKVNNKEQKVSFAVIVE